MQHQHNSQQVIANSQTLEDKNKRVQEQNEREKLARSYFIRDLIQRYPRLVLLGVSAFLFLAIYFSVVSIFQIDVLKEETKSTIATTKNLNTPSASTDNTLSLWLLGAIALGGTVGGVAIAKRLSNSSTTLSQFFLQFQPAYQPQQFPSSRQSILSLPALKLTEPKPTWAESSMETESESNIYSEDEFIILVEEDFLEDGNENFLEIAELTATEKNLTFEEAAFLPQELVPQMRSPIKDSPPPATASNSAMDNDCYFPRSQSLVEMLDLRQKLSLAKLLEVNR